MNKYVVFVIGPQGTFAIGPLKTFAEAQKERKLQMDSEPKSQAMILDLYRRDQVG